MHDSFYWKCFSRESLLEVIFNDLPFSSFLDVKIRADYHIHTVALFLHTFRFTVACFGTTFDSSITLKTARSHFSLRSRSVWEVKAAKSKAKGMGKRT
jgi:hypothetical protein